jgi:predicted ArsR family transcriptional regulator
MKADIKSKELAALEVLHKSRALPGDRSYRALAAVIIHGPGTANEILKAAGLDDNLNLWRARLSELVARGLIVECGMKREATGRQALVWRATGRAKPLRMKTGTGAKRRGARSPSDVAVAAIAALETHDPARAKELRAELQRAAKPGRRR